MAFEFTGLDPTYKVPRFIGKIVFSAGAISASDLPLYVLYCGPKTSAGTLVADNDVVEVFSEEEIDARAGAPSLLGWMARSGMKAAPTSRHFIVAHGDPAGATAATITVLIAGAPTGSGEWFIRIAGLTYAGVITPSSTVDTIGADIVAKIQADPRCPFVAAYNAGTDTLTLTCANVGAVGTEWIVQVDKSKLAPGITFTTTGLAALGGDRVRAGASGGVGTVVDTTIATMLTKLLNVRYARIATATNGASAAAAWETHVMAKADMLKLMLEQVVYGVNGSLGAATTLAQSTLNNQREQLLWMRNSDIHPAIIAAVKAAVRASTEGADPVPDYDGRVLPGIPGNLFADDNALDPEQNAALNSGVTPVVSVNGEARVVRSITSYSLLNGVTPDFRTIDIGDAVMTDYAMLDFKLMYETEFRPGNKYVRADPKEGELDPPRNVGFPKLWNQAFLMPRLLQYFGNGWIEDPNLNPPQSQFNKPSKSIESLVPLIVSRVQHQLKQIVRQTAS